MRNSFNPGIDFARLTACFMVVVLHVAGTNFYSFGEKWWATNFYDSLVRCSIPIFLMISGALLLTREKRVDVFFKKRYARIFPPLLFWSLFYIAWNVYSGTSYGGGMGWVKEIFRGPVAYHLWYLYAILGIYLFTPFLNKIYNNSLDIEKKIYIFLWISLASVWPILKAVLKIKFNLISTYALGSFSGLVGYLFLGAYLYDSNNNAPSRVWYLANIILFFIFSTLTMLATFWYSKQLGVPNEKFYSYLSPYVLLSAICAFNILYNFGLRLERYEGIIRSLSKCTLGIYCVHVFVIDRVQFFIGLSGATSSPWWSIPATATVVLAISLAVVLLMRMFGPLRYLT
jgi:surface polysaccharide O-acyltransferase-like enzyme